MKKSILSPQQQLEAAFWRDLGLTPSEARYRVLTPEQRREHHQQVEEAKQRRWAEDPLGEMIKNKRKSVESAMRLGKKYGAQLFTITKKDLEPAPTYCPVLPWIKLNYPGRFPHDPTGANVIIVLTSCARSVKL